MAEAKESAAKIEKAHCPTCNREQNCNMHGRVYKSWSWEDRQGHSIDGGDTYTQFECRGCETVFSEKCSWNDQNVDNWYDQSGELQTEPISSKETYPRPPSRPRPDWFDNIGKIDPTLFSLLEEMYAAYEQKCLVLTAIGLRTALDSCTASVQIDPAFTFQEKLRALKEEGYIGETEHDLLTVLTDAGNAAAHRGWSPEDEDIGHLLDVLENFVQRVLINGKRALAMKGNIPQRPKRRK